MPTRPTSSYKDDAAYAANLLAHPMAGVAAASALGMGMMTQAVGMWFGTMAAMLDAGRHVGMPADASREDTLAALKALARAASVMQDAQSLADEVASGDAVVVRQAKPSGRRKPSASAKSAADTAEKALVRPAVLARPATPDDLKAIGGIGPKLEQVLNGLGIWTFAQIAGWSKAEAAWVDDQLGFGGRIERDDWLGQASRLAKTR